MRKNTKESDRDQNEYQKMKLTTKDWDKDYLRKANVRFTWKKNNLKKKHSLDKIFLILATKCFFFL